MGGTVRALVSAAAFAALVYGAARLSYAYAFQPSSVVVLWAPAGLLLGALLTLERRRWPLAAGAALAAGIAADLGMGFGTRAALLGPAANVLESLLAAVVFQRFAGTTRPDLGRVREVLALTLGSAVAANAVTASLGAVVLAEAWGSGLGRAWFVWWIGDGVGMLVVTPLVLAAARAGRRLAAGLWRPPLHRVAEASLLFGLLAVVSQYALVWRSPSPGLEAEPYMVFPLLIWAALRFGPGGAALAAALVAAATVHSGAHAAGPFVTDDRWDLDPLLDAATYLALASFFSLLPAAAFRERERARELMRERELEYRALFEGNPSPMWVYDAETLAFLAVNDAAIASYGWSREEFLAQSIVEIRPPEDVPALLADLAPGRRGLDPARPWRHRRKSGEVFDVEVIANDVAWRGRRARLVQATDVSERRRLQEQLVQAQKMEAVGSLAGGVAHDFNNLLGVILGYAEMGLDDLGPLDPVAANLREIRGAGERAARLVRQLLTLSRQQIAEPRLVDLDVLVANFTGILDRTLGARIRLELRRAGQPALVRADPGALEQVILNLAVNARDAMPTGGQLTIETALADVDESFAEQHLTLAPGPYVALTVADTGIGMDAATQRRVFEPFFTTKGSRGTGLGLSTTYGIVRQSGGEIWLYSEPGRGTTFKIYLPRASGEAEERERRSTGAHARGDESILLVEDAESLRRLVHASLESRGYRVRSAADAESALAAEPATPADLLVTDVVLPGLDGRELARRLLAEGRVARVLYVSGYTETAIDDEALAGPGVGFLQKPFALEDLCKRVRALLDGPAARRP